MAIEDLGNPVLNNTYYNVQYKNAFTPPEQQTLNNVKRITRIHNNLINLGEEKGRDRFQKLDNDVQDLLKFFYGEETEYMMEPQSFWGAALGKVKDALTSPFQFGLDVAETAGRAIMTPINAGLQASQNGANFFDADVWSKAFNDGESLYDNELDRQYEKTYGRERSFIAKMALAGKRPGEILAAYGKPDEQFAAALESYLNEPEKWSDGILEDYRQAKLSVGRVFATEVLGARSGQRDIQDGKLYDFLNAIGFNKTIDKDFRDSLFTRISGTVDAATTILSDPLTYLTGGGSVGYRFFGKAVGQISKANDFAKAGNIKEVFQLSKVRSFWDGYGAKLKELNEAKEAGDFVKQAKVIDDIKVNFSQHGTDEEIDLLSKAGVHSADDAYKYFESAENTHMLLVGRTSDTTYFRESVAVAKGRRLGSQLIRQKWSALGRGQVDDLTLREEVDSAVSELIKQGEKLESGTKSNYPTLFQLQARNKQIGNRILNVLAKHPGDESIWINDNVNKTLDTVRNLARVIMPKDHAEVFALKFAQAQLNERVVLIRGLHRSILEVMGLDKTPAGRDVIEEILNTKYGTIGMSTTANLGPAKRFNLTTDELTQVNGAIHQYQTVPIIGNLPWEQIRQAAGDAAWASRGEGSKLPVISAMGGAVNGKLSTKVVDGWSLLTLAPKLGVRSSIDEAFFFGLTAPREVLFSFLSGQSKGAGKVITAFTGSKSAMGPVSSVARKYLSKLVKNPAVDPVNAISLARRHELLELAREEGLLGGDTHAIFNILLAAEATRSSVILNPENQKYIRELLTSNPHVIESAYSSVAKRTGLSGTVDEELRLYVNGDSTLDRMREELKVLLSNNYEEILPRNLKAHDLAGVMFNEFYPRFVGNGLGKDFSNLDMGELFIRFNGLRTADDFNGMLDHIFNQAYILNESFSAGSGLAMIERFNNLRAGSVEMRNRGISEQDIFVSHVKNIMFDMNVAFHGSRDGFNDTLLNEIKKRMADGKTTYDKVIKELTFEDYFAAVKNNLREEPIITNIKQIGEFKGDAASYYARGAEWMYDAMDRTATGLMRQPATTSYYLYYRKQFAATEKAYADKLYKSFSGNYPVGRKHLARERADAMAAKRYAEISSQAAVNHVLKYVDNPHVRTMFAGSARNVSRFFRATEDFWRRVYRLKDVSLRTAYRARMSMAGLEGAGTFQEDQNGEKYLVLPMDNILFSGIDPVLRTLSGGDLSFKQPMFNDLTVRLTAMNPSFQDEAGLPYLSGPIAALSVLGVQAITANFGGENGPKIADSLDNLAFGSIGDNLDLRKAIMPASVSRIWSILDTNEKARENNTAALSAIAYNQAHAKKLPQNISPEKRYALIKTGRYGLPSDATPQERDAYLQAIRISAHNLVVLRSSLGLIAPFSVGAMDSVGVPDYLRDTGVTSISAEYFDILDTVISKYGSEVSDPYAYAASIFVGRNPNKLIYTVSRNDKKVAPLIKKTEEVKDWVMSNQKLIDTYGEAAYFFAPHSGEINSAASTWLQAAGLVDALPFDEYLKDVQVAIDKQNYFAIGDWEDEQLSLTPDYYRRKTIIEQATAMRSQMRTANPLLDKALDPDGGFTVTQEEGFLKGITSIVDDPESPLSRDQRVRIHAMLDVFYRGYNYVTNPSLSSIPAYSRLKAGMRDKIMDELDALTRSDSMTRQIVNVVLKPLLKFHARNVPSATAPEEGTFMIGMN